MEKQMLNMEELEQVIGGEKSPVEEKSRKLGKNISDGMMWVSEKAADGIVYVGYRAVEGAKYVWNGIRSIF